MVGLTRELTNLKGMVKDLVDDVNRRRARRSPMNSSNITPC